VSMSSYFACPAAAFMPHTTKRSWCGLRGGRRGGRLSKAYRPNELPLDSAVATMVVAPPVASTQVRLLKAYPDRELAEFPTEVQKSLLEKAGVKYQIVELTC